MPVAMMLTAHASVLPVRSPPATYDLVRVRRCEPAAVSQHWPTSQPSLLASN
jgi:hypothetical protein